MEKRKWILVAAAVVALFLPFIIKAPYYQHMLIMVIIWAVMGTAWNLLGGYAGQVSFGHATFFGLGAYSAGILAHQLGITPWLGLLIGPLVATVICVPIGLICFRLRGPYFALAMLAVGEISRLVFTNWESLTMGAKGIMIIPIFTDKIYYYYIALAIYALTILVVYMLVNSKFGYYFVSIREDQDVAESLGIKTTLYKMYAFLPSAFFSGLIGAFYMNYVSFIDPHVVFSLSDISVMVILVVMLGGVATIWGPAIGAGIYIILGEVFRAQLGSASVLAFGILVCLVIMFMPNGIVGELDRFKKLFSKATKGGDKDEILQG